jgi:F-type H+-transporting ATPase subunit gamma
MPSPRDIRRRIRSVKNTAQITKAMQMVAASKMRRAQQSALSGRAYATLMNSVLTQVTKSAGDFTHALMEKREVKKRGIILVTSDKGLAGALNANILREATRFERDTTIYIAAGRKGSQFVARTKRNLAAEFTFKDAPMFAEARAISRFAQDLFSRREVDSVEILFTNFINTLNLKPEARPFLPVTEIKAVTAGLKDEDKGDGAESTTEYVFEPSATQVLGALLPHYLNYQVYQILLEAKASEHSARMVAMKNATDNAKQLIKDLTLEYNKLRQSNITRELLEITSAAMAMV